MPISAPPAPSSTCAVPASRSARHAHRHPLLAIIPALCLAAAAGCGPHLGGGEQLDFTETPPAPEAPATIKGKPASQPLDAAP